MAAALPERTGGMARDSREHLSSTHCAEHSGVQLAASLASLGT
jgi:hypothetical protein